MKELNRFTIAFTLVFLSCSPTIQAAKILVSLTLPVSSSHAHGVSSISRALVDAGHDVTILTSSSAGTRRFSSGSYTRALQFNFDDSHVDIHAIEEAFFEVAFQGSAFKTANSMSGIFEVIMHACRCLLEDDATLSKLRALAFDVVIGDVFDGCDALLSSYLDVRLIAVTTSVRYPFFDEHIFGIPAPSSYLPIGLFPLSDKMTFWDRVLSFLEHNVLMPVLQVPHFRKMNKMKDEKGIAPGRDLRDLLAKAEMWLCLTSFAFDFPKPLAPNKIHIGGLANTPAKPLTKEYEDFIEGSGSHGFIIFSLGTHFSQFPDPEIAEHFARAFSQVPQRVIWRYTGPRPHHLGNNTKIFKWLPQNDLLGHPKARLLIYHGGMHGIYEAIYHAVPMVIMPIFAEQHSNAANVEERGIGRKLNKDTLSPESILEVVNEVIENPKYLDRVRHFSGIHRDTPSDPGKTVVYWVEHVLKFGASHLRLRSTDLSTIQLYSIDVLAFFTGCALLTMFIFVSLCRCCLTRCCKKQKSKSE